MPNQRRVLYPFSMGNRKRPGITLHEAQGLDMVVRVSCNLCKQHRLYKPEDLRQLLGNREIDSLRRRLTCEGCGKNEWVEVEGMHLYPQERLGLTLRRLKSIRIIRRPVWEDEPL